MAAGSYRIRTVSVLIFPGTSVSIEFLWGVEDGAGNVPCPHRGKEVLTWSQFTSLITGQELSGLGSINGKLKGEVKTRRDELENATDF